MMSRRALVQRQTHETQLRVELDLDGGDRTIDVPSGFFSHMLDALSKHGGFGLELSARGDTDIDLHHTVEDTGIAIGQALWEALGERRGLVRFAHAYCPAGRGAGTSRRRPLGAGLLPARAAGGAA